MSAVGSLQAAQGVFRAEIQGLRAVAIALVLVFHVWPQSITGGYVGVDVFFVISGYLITRVLYQEYAASGRIDVVRFYERRIRRLMPAATLVLLASVLLLFLLPATQREDGAKSVIASALYVQNWWLSAQAVDYLAAESAPGLLNHFWSLAVEEQYYIFWPVMVFAVGGLFIRSGSTHARAFTTLVIAVLVASLVYSIWLTGANPQRAYFSTFTRGWELAIGGLLAITSGWRSLNERWRNVLGLTGLAAILLAAFTYDTSTQFPGYAALLPTLGAALIIAAGESGSPVSAYRLMALRPMQLLGDVSYSLYLWHWPVIIAYGALAGRAPNFFEGVIIVGVAFSLAYTTKLLIEDRFRHHGHPGSRRNAFLMAAGCIVSCCLVALFILKEQGGLALWGQTESMEDAVMQAPQDNPGAEALWRGVAVNDAAAIRPALSDIKNDLPAPYAQRCISRGSSHEVKVCRYGQEGGMPVALIGDAQAVQWQPALADLADANGWDLQVLTKTGCVLGSLSAEQTGFDAEKQAACMAWENGVIAHLKQAPAQVAFIAQSASPRLADGLKGAQREQVLAEGLARFRSQALAAQTTGILIRAVPNAGRQCSDPSSLIGCSRPRTEAVAARDPVVVAASLGAGKLLDPMDGICDQENCNAVVGNVIVYRANGLLGATYARSMGGLIARELDGMAVFAGSLKVADVADVAATGDLIAKAMAAKRDNPDLYADGCHLNQVESKPRGCVYGVEDADVKVVLAGDSHSAQWLPALQELARTRRWKVYSFTKSACAFSDAAVDVGGREYTACTEWNENVMAEIAAIKPDFVLMSQSRGQRAYGSSSPEESQERLSDGLVSRWRILKGMGVPVIAVEGTPWMVQDVPDCVSSVNFRPGGCDATLEQAFRLYDAIAEAHRKFPDAVLVSVNGDICDSRSCHAVIDGEVIYRDRHHLTATFVRSLADRIGRASEMVLN